ncbi:MAG: hypothetical protein EKK56_04780 [Flavobacteriaceae bacterium]|nr:MAG: hypothetical protein EKK56_04780 [Flavobacteriaceae bacterium]
MILNTIEQIKNHPFTFMQLADKEKFHTGFIAYAMREYPKLLNNLLNDDRNYLAGDKYKVLVEHDSTDILIVDEYYYDEPEKFPGKDKITPFAVIEVKFKSTMHNSKRKDDVIPQLTKYEEKYKKHNPRFIYIYLFEEAEIHDHFSKTWKFVSYQDLISMIEPIYGSGHIGDVQIIGTWISYMKLLVEFSKFIKGQGLFSLKTAYQSNEKICELINEIKLKSLVDHYRYSLVLSSLLNSNLIQSPLFKYTNKNEEKRTDAIYYLIDNTHGNGLLHFEIFNGKTTYGIQWQSSTLKLYMHAESKNNSERDEELVATAIKMFGEGEYSLNRDGVFRSISIYKELSWDIYDDQNDKTPIIADCLNKLASINK